ncbi:MAG TPA: arsenate reductase ArsC [Mycobacteriales bacterium]|jgi:protein-tyrosine-phosphatase|nr:arsenate reductase ArsC [Mycobacteriales bacterium]
MTHTDVITDGVRSSLAGVARDLHRDYDGVFSEPAIETLVETCYLELAKTATVNRWLVLSTENFARQRLDALVHSEAQPSERPPAVLFLCVHNAGRSQMALGYFNHLAGDRAIAWSGGSEPGEHINGAAIDAMTEVGIDITREFPKPWTQEFFAAADVVVTMGCGDTCPLVPGKRYEDWDLPDPAGKTLAEVRPIRDDIEQRVRRLLDQLGVAAQA